MKPSFKETFSSSYAMKRILSAPEPYAKVYRERIKLSEEYEKILVFPESILLLPENYHLIVARPLKIGNKHIVSTPTIKDYKTQFDIALQINRMESLVYLRAEMVEGRSLLDTMDLIYEAEHDQLDTSFGLENVSIFKDCFDFYIYNNIDSNFYFYSYLEAKRFVVEQTHKSYNALNKIEQKEFCKTYNLSGIESLLENTIG